MIAYTAPNIENPIHRKARGSISVSDWPFGAFLSSNKEPLWPLTENDSIEEILSIFVGRKNESSKKSKQPKENNPFDDGNLSLISEPINGKRLCSDS